LNVYILHTKKYEVDYLQQKVYFNEQFIRVSHMLNYIDFSHYKMDFKS